MTKTITAPASLKEAVLDHIPGYRDAERRYNRLRDMSVIVGLEHTEVDHAYNDRILQAAGSDSETDLSALEAEYIADHTAYLGRAAFYRLVGDTRERARNNVRRAQRAGTDSALNFLRDELNTLMTEVAANRDIIAAHPTADAMIGASSQALDNWNLVNALINRYDDIRTEHRRYLTFQVANTRDAVQGFATTGQCARFLEADPYWLQQRATSPGHTSTDPGIATWFRRRSSRAEHRRTSIWPTVYPRNRWLLIVADNQPWLPDVSTIDEANRLANELFGSAYRQGHDIDRLHRLIDQLQALGASTDLATTRGN